MPSLTLLLADVLAHILIMSPGHFGPSCCCLSSNTTTLSPMEGCCSHKDGSDVGSVLHPRTSTYVAQSLQVYPPNGFACSSLEAVGAQML